MIGAEPYSSLLSLLFCPGVAIALVLLYSIIKALCSVAVNLVNIVKNGYINLFTNGYFKLEIEKSDRLLYKVIGNIFSFLYILLGAFIMSIYFYVLCDGVTSIAGLVIVLVTAVLAQRKIKLQGLLYRVFGKALLLIIFLPLSIVRFISQIRHKRRQKGN